MRPGPLQKLGFVDLAGLCACSPIIEVGSKSPVTLYPTAELGNSTEQDQLEKASSLLKTSVSGCRSYGFREWY